MTNLTESLDRLRARADGHNTDFTVLDASYVWAELVRRRALAADRPAAGAEDDTTAPQLDPRDMHGLAIGEGADKGNWYPYCPACSWGTGEWVGKCLESVVAAQWPDVEAFVPRAAAPAVPAPPDVDELIRERDEALEAKDRYLDDLQDVAEELRRVRMARAVPAAPDAATELRRMAEGFEAIAKGPHGWVIRADAAALRARADELDAAVRAARGETT